MNKEFLTVFQLSKTKVLFVEYYTLSTNSRPDFTMSAAEFCRNKLDYTRCGQCQEEITKGFITAHAFVKKWNPHHLHDLTPTEYSEMLSDLEKLKARYNYIEKELKEEEKPYSPRISFYRIAEFTKQNPKKTA